MFDLVLNLPDGEDLDLSVLKVNANEFAKRITGDELYEPIRDELKAKCIIEIKGASEAPKAVEAPAPELTKSDKKAADKAAKQADKQAKDAAKEAEKTANEAAKA